MKWWWNVSFTGGRNRWSTPRKPLTYGKNISISQFLDFNLEIQFIISFHFLPSVFSRNISIAFFRWKTLKVASRPLQVGCFSLTLPQQKPCISAGYPRQLWIHLLAPWDPTPDRPHSNCWSMIQQFSVGKSCPGVGSNCNIRSSQGTYARYHTTFNATQYVLTYWVAIRINWPN